ncbi:MAG TPA: cupin domain-containing protein [Gemmatimonadaceae bacterium]
MSPTQHPVSGPALLFDLEEELQIVHEQLVSTSRSARTLAKNGSLRATLIGLAAGGSLAPHSAEGPITVHVLEGALDFDVNGQTWSLRKGSFLALDAGIQHSGRSAEGTIFLLTVSLATSK